MRGLSSNNRFVVNRFVVSKFVGLGWWPALPTPASSSPIPQEERCGYPGNTEGDYSAASYLPEGDLAPDASAVHLPPEADPDDFFFVTEPGLYSGLSAEGFPVVLQDNARVTDDGSLSVWAGRQGIPYVNIEAEYGHRERQLEMLEALAHVLEALPLVTSTN